jgi:AcrR family transcriptional regulator
MGFGTDQPMNLAVTPARTPVTERLIATTRRMIASSGLAGVNARPIATEAGASPSAIAYHFGGVDDLSVAAFEAALEDERDDQRTLLSELADLALHRKMFPAWFSALLWGDCHHRREKRAIRRELFQQCDRHDHLLPVARRWLESEEAFWRETLVRFDMDIRFGVPAIEARQGLDDVLSIGRFAPSSIAFVLSTADHFARRAAGLEMLDSGWRSALETQSRDRRPASGPEGSRTPARRRILDAAVRIITEGGVGHLTVRRLATESRSSPALAMAHFGSREGVVRATFEHIYATLISQIAATEPATGPGPGGLEGLITAYGSTMIGPTGAIQPAIAAMDELIGFASNDPEISDLAFEIIVSRGRFSHSALCSIADPEDPPPTRMDGLLLTLCGLAALSALRTTPVHLRAARLEADAPDRLALFLPRLRRDQSASPSAAPLLNDADGES